MRIMGLVFAVGVLGASPAFAATDEDPSQVSEIAGAFAGVAESCGLETQGYASRVEELLKHMAESSDQADQLIGAFNDK
jgi:HPt (histidine-containing phosphotransfer) domain-containing protein